MERLRKGTGQDKILGGVLLLLIVIWNGCFVFPLSLKSGLLAVLCYSVIGFAFAVLYERDKSLDVLGLMLLFTSIGIVLRYFIEFETPSAIYFAPLHIILFLAIVPVYCVAVHGAVARFMEKD